MPDPEIHARLLKALEQSDELRRSERADRIIWLSQHNMRPEAFMGPVDTMTILNEAQESFIDGHFIGAILLAAAFIEHTVVDELIEKKKAKPGVQFVEALRLAGDHNLLPADLLNRAEALRARRNPFAHRKSPDHAHSFGNRFLARKVHPRVILEEDAQEALSLMYAIFRETLKAA